MLTVYSVLRSFFCALLCNLPFILFSMLHCVSCAVGVVLEGVVLWWCCCFLIFCVFGMCGWVRGIYLFLSVCLFVDVRGGGLGGGCCHCGMCFSVCLFAYGLLVCFHRLTCLF